MHLVEKLGLVLLVTLIALGSLLVYLQTPHGFRQVIVPLAAKFTGARFEVRDGMLTLAGLLHIEGFRYEDPTVGVTIGAEQLTLRAAWWSFMTGAIPRIDDLELQQAQILINMTLRASGTREAENGQTGTRPVLVAIERARLEDLTVVVEQADYRITGRVSAMLNRLGPGQYGNVTIRTGFLRERKGIPDLLGTFDLNLPVEIAADGSSITWNGSNRLFFRTSAGELDPTDPEVVHVEQALDGNYHPASQSLKAASHLAISRAGTKLGTIDLTGETNVATRPTVTDASLIWRDIRGDILDLWLREAAGPHVQSGRFNAQLQVHNEGSRTSVKVNATGSNVRFRSGESEASPPVDLSIEHAGSFDSSTMVVTMEILTINIIDRGRTLLSGALDRPVVLNLARPEKETGRAETDPQSTVFSLRLTPSDIRDLRPWLALLGRHTLREVAAGRLEGGLVISTYDHGAMVDVAGRVEGTGIQMSSERSGRTGTRPLQFVTEWKSRMTDMQQLKLDPATTTVSLKDKQVAVLHATGQWRLGDPAGLTALSGNMTLTGLPGENLNPLLVLWSETTIAQGQIDGHAEFAVDEREIRWKVDLRNRGLQLHMPATASDAPPVNLEIKQTGKLDRAGRVLQLDRMRIQAVEGQRPIVTVALDRPLTLSLVQGKKKDNANSDAAADEITLNLSVNRLGVHQVRPWLAMTGSQVLAGVRGGVFDTDVKVRLKGIDDIAVAGRVDVDRVTFAPETQHSSVPVTLETEIRASIAGGSRMSFDSWAIRALDRNRQLAQVRLTGSADFGGATDLVLDVKTTDVSDLVDRLGLLTERQYKMISGGDLTGDVRVVGAGPDQPLTIKADLRAAKLGIRLDRTHKSTRTFGVLAEMEIDGARTTADIQRIEVNIDSDGTNAGTFLVSGRWPLTDQATTTSVGSMSVTVKEWDSRPLVEFLDILPGREPGPLMVSGALNVAQRAGGRTIVVQGSETVGPITVAVKGRPGPEPATIHVEHLVTQNRDEIQIAKFSMNSERPIGLADQVTMKGTVRSGLRPHLQLRGSVNALDADWYAALLAPPMSETPEEQAITGAPPPLKEIKEKKAGFGLPLDLDVDLAIGTLTYRNLPIGAGRLLANGDGQSMHATLEPTGVARGSVQGTFAIAQKDGQQDITWDATGNALDLSLFLKALFNEPESRITGLGRFTTTGTGRGQGEALRNSLSGIAVFDVENGRFAKSPVMEFLAKQTRIEEFQGAEFKTFHVELHIKDGWMRLNQTRAVGSMYAVEAEGKIGLDGQLDAQIFPKVGPTFSKHITIRCLDQFAKASDGFTLLPVSVTVKGTTGNPQYGTSAGAFTRQGGELLGVIANLLTGCTGGDSAKSPSQEAGN